MNNRRSIFVASIASGLCSLGMLGVVMAFPDGNLHRLQLQTLVYSALTGIVVLGVVGFRSTPNSQSSFSQPLFVPNSAVSIGLACLVVLGSAIQISKPLAAQIVQDFEHLLKLPCEATINQWPERPTVADYRQLEWEILDSTALLDEFARKVSKQKLHESRSIVRIEQNAHLAGWGQVQIRSISVPQFPATRQHQYERMGERIRHAITQLVASAQGTQVRALAERAEAIRLATQALWQIP